MNGSDPKQIARELLEEAHPALIGLSHWIHANPELGYQEVLASGWVTEWLTTAGFEVRTGVAGMPTAIIGSYGPGPFHIAVCVEYDALPAVGHACGHNVIAAAGVGAGLALAAVADELGLRVTVMGTPAEETGGGKIGLIKAGELDGVHVAMMVHPWPQDEATPTIIAIRSLNVTYTGKEAHAAGFPYLGVNAADALVVAQTAIALLRQQLRTTDRVHGIVTKGGDAPNIIPARTEAQWMVRGTDVARLDEVTALVRRCFEAGALATGATLGIVEEICYADVRHDPDLSRLYQSNAEQLGRTFSAPGMPVSTDMGNVSYVVPTIHPMLGVEANGAVNHQADFATACATPSADRAIFDGALAMAWTAIDAAQDDALRARLMAFVADPAEVAMVSSAWMMPPVPGMPAASEALAPESAEAVDADGDGVVDPVAEAGLDPDAGWALAADTVAVSELAEAGPADADALDADAAWAADVDAVKQQMIAIGLLQAADVTDTAEVADAVEVAAESEAEPVLADGALEEVLFIGFDEASAEPVADMVLVAAVADTEMVDTEMAEATVPDPEPVLDVWVTPEVLGEWLESPAAPDAVAADAGPGVAAVDDSAVPVADWFAADPADLAPAPEPVVPATPVTAPAVAAVAAARLQDRDAWERAFEEAAARIGWEEQFEAAINERIAVEGMDRSEAIADLASDLQDAADERAEAPAAAPGWPPASTELVSREHIEAEGFSYVAPEVASRLEERGDPWSLNGNGKDHAAENLHLT